jgi:hypothetical protein
MRNSLLRRYAAAQGGQLAEVERMRVVEETCRHASNLCAAVMARWIVETPVSPLRDRMRSKLSGIPMIMRSGRLKVADELVSFFDDAPVAIPEHVTPEQAVRTSKLYAELYHHAMPFSRRKLLEVWRRCETDPKQAQACFLARMNLKRTLGDLGE